MIKRVDNLMKSARNASTDDAGAMLSAVARAPEPVPESVYDPVCGEGKYILTPPASPMPRINGPAVFGVRPGAPFLYTIPVTGSAPVLFEADGLPEGLQLDTTTGMIRGRIIDKAECEYPVKLRARNKLGGTEKNFTIIVGDTICLTPPLGWNSWNCWQNHVNETHVLDSARAMVEKGLKNLGWSYVNIDDTWQGRRGGPLNAIQPDPKKFPDMKGLCEQIHAMGLKVGIYSSPWITTYAGRVGGSSDSPDGEWHASSMGTMEARKSKDLWRVGEYTFDENDAAQWAEWGIDYLKYDWNPNDPESTLRMAAALRKCGRDIVYSLSNSAPLQHAELYAGVANCWRTAGDLKDRWDEDGPHVNLREQWERHRRWTEEGVRGGPGHFPDADMLVVGDVIAGGRNGKLRPSRLTADEQYAHISLWVLWACPMLIGCPIETMDAFTLNLLSNADVLDVHQDSFAVPGRSVRIANGVEVIVKELSGGGKAIGLFNLNDDAQVVTLLWEEAGLIGGKTLRDLWRQIDIGVFTDSFSARVRSHGVVLVRAD